MSKDERHSQLAQIMGEMDAIINSQMLAFNYGGTNSTDSQKFSCATLAFDLCFNFGKEHLFLSIQK